MGWRKRKNGIERGRKEQLGRKRAREGWNGKEVKKDEVKERKEERDRGKEENDGGKLEAVEILLRTTAQKGRQSIILFFYARSNDIFRGGESEEIEEKKRKRKKRRSKDV